MKEKLSRRDFLQLASYLGISLCAANYFFLDTKILATTPIKAGGSRYLSYAQGLVPSELTRAAIDKLGGIKKFVSSGDIVALKPNIAWDRKPGYGANTTPEIYGTIAKMCKDAGAKKVKILEYPCVDAKVSFSLGGAMKISQAVGAEIHFLEDRTLQKVKIDGNFLKSWPVFSEFIEADKIINIPIAKHHSLSELSIGMKNWMGAIGDDRGYLHENIHTSIADLASYFKPVLTIVDMTKVLIRNGPRGGNLRDVKNLNTVLASTDVVAIDSFAASFMGKDPRKIGYIKLAHEYGLGEINFNRLLTA